MLRRITLRCVALHSFVLHCIGLLCMPLHGMVLVAWCPMAWCPVALRRIAWCHIASHSIVWKYVAWHCIASHCSHPHTSRNCITLRFAGCVMCCLTCRCGHIISCASIVAFSTHLQQQVTSQSLPQPLLVHRLDTRNESPLRACLQWASSASLLPASLSISSQTIFPTS